MWSRWQLAAKRGPGLEAARISGKCAVPGPTGWAFSGSAGKWMNQRDKVPGHQCNIRGHRPICRCRQDGQVIDDLLEMLPFVDTFSQFRTECDIVAHQIVDQVGELQRVPAIRGGLRTQMLEQGLQGAVIRPRSQLSIALESAEQIGRASCRERV